MFTLGGDPEDPLQAQARVLQERGGDQLDEALRRIGLYTQNKELGAMETSSGPWAGLVITVQVGDLAFAERETDIEAAEYRTREIETDRFLDARSRWRRLLEETDGD